MAVNLGLIASSITGNLSSSDFDLIERVTLSSNSTITFSSIPTTYKGLQLRIFGKTTRPTYKNDYLSIRFNEDGGNNYASHETHGDGSAREGNSTVNYNKIYNGVSVGSTVMDSNTFGSGIIDILDYNDTNKKTTTRGIGGWQDNSSGFMGLCNGLWYNTAAVTSITLLGGEGAYLASGTTVGLYGIKGMS